MRIFILLIATFLFAYKLKEERIIYKDYPILKAKELNNEFYFVTSKDLPKGHTLINFFPPDITLSKKNEKFYLFYKNDTPKALKFNVKYSTSFQNYIALATLHKVYIYDRDLKLKKIINFDNKILSLASTKEYLGVLTKTANSLSLIIFNKDFKEKNLFLNSNSLEGKLIGSNKYFLFDEFNSITIINPKNTKKINIDSKPHKLVKLIDYYLYYYSNSHISKYYINTKVWEFKVGEIKDFFINQNQLILFKNKKIILAKIIGPKTTIIPQTPINLTYNRFVFVTTKKEHYYLNFFSKDLLKLAVKNLKAKINFIQIFNDKIFFCGKKDAEFFVQSTYINKKTLFLGECFDVVKNKNYYLAVGSKRFDFLGDFIQSLVLVKLDKNLNIISSKTYFKNAKALKIIKHKNEFLILAFVNKDFYILLFDSKLKLKNYKKLDFEPFDFKLIDNYLYITSKENLYIYDKTNPLQQIKLPKNYANKILNSSKIVFSYKDNTYIYNLKTKKKEFLSYGDIVDVSKNYILLEYERKSILLKVGVF